MSGSETRRRGKVIKVRCDETEFDFITAKAVAADVAAPTYLRVAALKGRLPRSKTAQTFTSEDRQQLAKLLAGLGRVSGNVNQIARALNFEQHPKEAEFDEVLQDLTVLRRQVRDFLHQAKGS